jgi:hypothetical protein
MQNAEFFDVQSGGTYTKHCALKEFIISVFLGVISNAKLLSIKGESTNILTSHKKG